MGKKTKRRILFITDYFNYPFDEGIKKTAFNLYLELGKKYFLKVICKVGFKDNKIIAIQTNRLYLSYRILKIIKLYKPETIIYFPFASGTFASYLRLKVLQLYSPKSKFIFIALQNKPLKNTYRYIIKKIKPDIALTPSTELKKFWDKANIENWLLPLFTDLSVFKPVTAQHKMELRKNKI